VSENRVPKRIFGHKMKKQVAAENFKMIASYFLSLPKYYWNFKSKSKRVRTGRGWSPLGRPKGRWEAITKMDFKERG
jgi:hypothetical protein